MRKILRRQTKRAPGGQALVEFALAAPLFFMVLVGIIVLGIMVFYNQQLTNAAREAARFAAIHSASAPNPVVGTLDPRFPDPNTLHTPAWTPPLSYYDWDRPQEGWPMMSAHARSKTFGLNRSDVLFSACWSGYRTTTQYDTPPPATYDIAGQPYTVDSAWAQCQVDGVDPTQDAASIDCQTGLPTTDTASSMSEGQGRIVANRVTVFACFEWSPPGAGFLLIPQTLTFRAVISEPIQRQQ